MRLRLAVDYEQHTGDQRAYSRDDAQYSTHTYTKETKARNYQEYPEQNPFQLTHIHFNSPLS